MQLQRIKLRGFKGIRHGLGRDEIELDLSGLSGLVALTGKNGAGKTTLMENLQPFPQVVSRPAPALKNHVCLRDSLKELDFVLDGDLYRTQVKVDAHSGRSEGYIWRGDRPLVDGKITSFTAAIAEMFGTPDLFFSSVFAAQGSAKLSDMKKADITKLFGEFLRLDRYFAWEQAAKSCEAEAVRALVRYKAEAESLLGRIEAFGDVDAEIAAARERAAEITAAIKLASDDLRAKEEERDDARTRAAKADAFFSQLDEIERQRNDAVARRREIEDEQATTIDGLRRRHRTAEAEIRQATAALGRENEIRQAADDLKATRTSLVDVRARLRAARKVSGEAREKADTRKQEFEQATAEHRQRLDALSESARLAERKAYELRATIDRIENEINRAAADPDLAALEHRIADARRVAADLEKRGTITVNEPVGGVCGRSFNCNSEDCAFVAHALKARDDLPGLISKRDAKKAEAVARIEALRREQAETRDGIGTIDTEAARAAVEQEKQAFDKAAEGHAHLIRSANYDADKTAAEVRAIETNESMLADEAEALEALAGEAVGIEAARATLARANEDADRLAAEIERATSAYDSKLAKSSIEIGRLDARAKEMRADADAYKGAKALAEQLDREIADESEAIDRRRSDLAACTARVEGLEADKRRVEGLRAQADDIEGRRAVAAAEAGKWAYLKTACGRDGLRALEIDATAPMIAAYANDLLTRAQLIGHTVGFRTLDEQGREVLEPVVTREDGTTEIIGQYSGGEKTWDLKALRLALTLVSKQKSQRDFRTAFADEEDGALDLEAARAFIRMYREFLVLGGFDSIFYISHKPECVGMADHRIVFNGGVSVD